MIASILEDIQEGQIFKNSDNNPTHFFVINKFGFCQDFYSVFDEQFFETIKKLICERKYKKLRYYSPTEKMEEYITSLNFAQRSERIKFDFSSKPNEIKISDEYKIERITMTNLKSIDFGLDFANRYWNNEQDFIDNAIGVAVFNNNKAFGCCYSAANGINKAEIDIYVDDNYRNKGLGNALGNAFIKECINRNLSPSWDCYSNNLGSVNLAKKLGFKESFKYNFYNITGRL